MNVIGIIPARYFSTRLEGKPLVDICGKAMIQHVYDNISKSPVLTDLIVATDDQRVHDTVKRFGGKAVLTSKEHTTGTDRVAEVARSLAADVVVNIQGDEPFILPGMIDEIVSPFSDNPDLCICTLMHRVNNKKDFDNPNVVKVVADLSGYALYFSRSLIPYPRNDNNHRVFEHIGLYAYNREFLLTFSALPQTPLEKLEMLEQLRALENGYKIKIIETKEPYIPLSVDTPEDLNKARTFAASYKS